MLKGILLILVIGTLTLWPSFNLALTGDDYLGLWRYNYYINGVSGEIWNNLSYFLTDYGPMDTLTAIIHNSFGFSHQAYYIIAFLFRVIASLSFVWPVYRLTKNKWSSLFSAGFFLITTTGLEATDWSFNMPSYLAIGLLNCLLGVFLLTRNKNNLFTWLMSAILFLTAIVVQPIRMLFLPGLIIGLEIYWLITHFRFKSLVFTTFRISMYAILFLTLWSYSSYGQAVSARGSSFIKNYGQAITHWQNKDYKIFLSPISQIGTLVYPNNFLYQRTEVWGLPRTFRRIVMPTAIGFVVLVAFFRPSKKILGVAIISTIAWTATVWRQFVTLAPYPPQPFELFSYFLGGYIIIASLLTWWKLTNQNHLRLILITGLLIIIGSFIAPWLRNPGTIHEITGRYLIVSGAGLAWLMALPWAVQLKGQRKWALVVLSGLLFCLHARSSHRFLFHLSEVRGIEMTERLRNSVIEAPNITDSKVATVYYFEGDDPEILHHAFIFGWPVISSFKYGFAGSWYHVAPTNKWEEVVSAYIDGQSLTRFMPEPKGPTGLENIFAYRLENKQLIDVTEEKREILKNLKTKPQQPF